MIRQYFAQRCQGGVNPLRVGVVAIGSITGGLWVSENGVDRRSAVPTWLPPVYAVMFLAK